MNELPRNQCEQRSRNSPEICPFIDFTPSTPSLLGRHEGRSSHRITNPRCVRSLRVRDLGNTEIEQLDFTICRYEQILWLDVAMKDAFFMGGSYDRKHGLADL